MAANERTLNDEDGDSSDWIEIFNSNASTVNLNGWFLTDDLSNLAKWRFPEMPLPSNAYLVVFASDKDRTSPVGGLHTNFKLAAGGGHIALVSPDRNIAPGFPQAYPKQFSDVSYGQVQGHPQTTGYLAEPTPGGPNSAGGSGIAPDVQFSWKSSTLVAPFELVLRADSAGALIRYTLDGSLPTDSSPAYVAPLSITNSVQIHARSFVEGWLPGPPRSEAFVLLGNDIQGFTSDLPVLVIHSFGQSIPFFNPKGPARLLAFEPYNGVTSLTNPATLATRVGINVRSGGGVPRLSFTLEIRDEFDRDKHQEFLGLPAESDWVLYGPTRQDRVLVKNPFIHQLGRDFGRYSPRTRFVEVYLNEGIGPIGATNYSGIYVLEEKIKIGKHRLDIDKLKPEHVAAPEITGGYLLAVDLPNAGEFGFFSYFPTRVVFVDPKEADLKSPARAAQLQYLRTYFGEFSAALNGADWRDARLGYPAYIDVDSWIDWNIIEAVSGNIDSMAKSSYFYKARNGKIEFGPHWDFDNAMGGGGSSARDWGSGGLYSGWWGPLFRDADFWQKWIDRYQQLRCSQLSITNMATLIDRLTTEVRKAQPREQKRWNPQSDPLAYERAIDSMKNWLSNKVEWIDQQLAQPPVLSFGDNSVSLGISPRMMATKDVAIYFTLDGSDPRLAQGQLSPTAHLFERPIVLGAGGHLVARTYNASQRHSGGPPLSSPWSGPIAADLVCHELDFAPHLRIEPGNPIRLSFSAAPGSLHTIQYRDDLTIGAWRTLREIAALPMGCEFAVTDLATNRTRFYRLRSD